MSQLSEEQQRTVDDLANKLWNKPGFKGARRVLAYETLHKIYSDQVDQLLLRGIKEESNSLFIDVRFVCLSRERIFPLLLDELRRAWNDDPAGRTSRRLIDILEARTSQSIGLDEQGVAALDPGLREALRFRE